MDAKKFNLEKQRILKRMDDTVCFTRETVQQITTGLEELCHYHELEQKLDGITIEQLVTDYITQKERDIESEITLD